jgi:outer membrane protein assembly factor BamB
MLVVAGAAYTSSATIPGTNIGAWAKGGAQSVEARAAKLANTPSFANGYTTAWSENASTLASQTDTDTSQAFTPTLVAQTSKVWAYSNGAQIVGVNAQSGSTIWSSPTYAGIDCISGQMHQQLVCMSYTADEVSGSPDHPDKLLFMDVANGTITSSVPLADFASASTDTLSLRAVYKDSVILQDETNQCNDKIECLTSLLALDSSGKTIWRSKQFYSGVEANNMSGAFASHIRIADGVGVFVNYSPGRVGSFAINLDNGGLLSASGSELFGTTLVAGGSGGSASSSSFTMPSGKAGTIVQGDPVTFATGTPVPSHPILQRNDSSSAVGYEAPPTAISSPDYGWTIDSSTPGMTLKSPSVYGTFVGAYNNGELVFLDDTGHVIRVDERSGKILWSSTYTGFSHELGDDYCVRAAVLDDGTVLVQDYTHPAVLAPDGEAGIGFVVALSGETGAQLWQADGNTPLDAYEGMSEASDTSSIAQQLNDAIPVITGSAGIQGSSQTIARLDPVKPQPRVKGMPSAIASCPAGWTPVSWSTWNGDTPGHTLVCRSSAVDTYYVFIDADGALYSTQTATFSDTGCYVAKYDKDDASAQVCFDGGATWFTGSGATKAYVASDAWNASGTTTGFSSPPSAKVDIPDCPAGSSPLSLSTWDDGLLLTCGTSAGSVTKFILHEGSKTSAGSSMKDSGKDGVCGQDDAGQRVCQTSDTVSIGKDGSTTAFPTSSSFTPQAGQRNSLHAKKATTVDDAQAQLDAEVKQDKDLVESNLVGMWTPQLSAKYIGFNDGTTDYDAKAIWNQFQTFKQKYPTALLLKGADWSSLGFTTTPSLQGHDWYTMESGITYSDPNEANRWCSTEGFTPENCFAVQVSHGPADHTAHMWKEGDF